MKQLNILDAVFCKDNGKEYYGFISEVQKKIEIIKPDAYYVFNNKPLILFFDLTYETDNNREAEIHKKVWSFDNSPVIFVIKGEEIKVYNALNYSKKDEHLEEIKLSENERNSKFSFWELQSGHTWQWLQMEYFEKRSKNQKRKRVNEQLFQNIKQVRQYLTNKHSENSLNEEDANSLILRLIFIRYLIDRKVKIDNTYLPGNSNDVNERRKNFIELIKKPLKLNLLFKKLNTKFNGVLFKKQNLVLTQKQSNDLADIFKGELQDENNLFNGFFFEIFDFSIIPVEVISGIYESLIDEKTRKLDSAVYTPPFLVEYILNDTVDKYLEEKNISECKIFEVAVGSGIFLVQSLRKMIDKELELNPSQSHKEFSKRIRQIATRNLFGVDINEEALKVTCFSIYIALLDYQDPKDIDSYEFPDLLDKNLFKANFFDTNHRFNKIIKTEIPKFILGNPPWKNGSKDKIHVDYLKSNKLSGVVSDYQLAQSFILRTKDFSQNNLNTPICSLVVTSKVFYNNKAINFKKRFLSKFNLTKYLDLSPVRRDIFKNAINPSAIILFNYANDEITNKNQVKFYSIKKNLFLKKFNMLIFEKQDIKNIPQEYFMRYSYMFKVATYGNTLDFNFIKRILENSNNYSLNSLFNDNSIISGKGLFRGTPKKHYPYLEGKSLVKRKELKEYYTPFNDKYFVFKKEDTYLEAGRTEALFNGKKIIIQKSTDKETNIKFTLLENGYAFDSTVYGITFDDSNKHLLKIIFSIFLSKIYTYYQFMTSSSWGIYRPELLKTEHLSFPFIAPNNEEEKVLNSSVDLFLNNLKNHYENFSLGNIEIDKNSLLKIDSTINELYKVNAYENDLIDYTLNVSRYQFQENKQYLVSNFSDDKTSYRYKDFVLKEYASVYLKEFKEIYLDEYIQVEVYPLAHFIALNFVFTLKKPKNSIIYPKNKNSEKEVLKRLAHNLSISQLTDTTDATKNLFIQKDIKGFEDNSFYIIKPNEYKCWHKAIAWYDVAEFKEAIQEAEINQLNQDI
ncbi:DNA methyltransferase [Kordia algicida OT-1]|uniref:DNA methyltransferase n=1 Tax=Kordia algicida TaxID=221066 RepID=UPI000317BDF2|nr:DNA methyltransferase [Kordia algicida]